jgi:2-dehydropantoate 2-reductase
LELAEWKVARLLLPRFWSLAMASSREAEAVVSGVAPKGQALSRSVLRHALRFALPIIKRMAPLDIERYLEFHFTKVGPQTLLVLDSLIEAGEARPSGQVKALVSVRDRLRKKRAAGQTEGSAPD